MPFCLSLLICSLFFSRMLFQYLCFNLSPPLLSPQTLRLFSRRSWQMFWRSVTWCSRVCSVSRCCSSSWHSVFLATSRTPTTASTASSSSSGWGLPGGKGGGSWSLSLPQNGKKSVIRCLSCHRKILAMSHHLPDCHCGADLAVKPCDFSLSSWALQAELCIRAGGLCLFTLPFYAVLTPFFYWLVSCK